MSELHEAQAKRALAERARRLAKELTLESDRARLLKHAQELDEQADALEHREACRKGGPKGES